MDHPPEHGGPLNEIIQTQRNRQQFRAVTPHVTTARVPSTRRLRCPHGLAHAARCGPLLWFSARLFSVHHMYFTATQEDKSEVKKCEEERAKSNDGRTLKETPTMFRALGSTVDGTEPRFR